MSKLSNTLFPSNTSLPTRLFILSWLLAPILLWFSYRPLLRFGSNQSMYFELSLALLLLGVLGVVALVILLAKHRSLPKHLGLLPVSIFVVVCTSSLLWTTDLIRGLLTVGVIGALYSIFIASICLKADLARLKPYLVKITLASAIFMSVLAIIQVIASIWLPSDNTLLCAGCTPNQLGFARPNVFTIEPQFLGNMFLFPTFLALILATDNPLGKKYNFAFFMCIVGLFITLSRGAIFAFGLAFIISVVLNYSRLYIFIRPLLLMLAGFIVVMLIQGTSATLSRTVNISFSGAINTSLNQLSLGIIKLPSTQTSPPAAKPPVTIQNNTTPPQANKEAPNFTGYVEESTNKRLSLTNYALQSWSSSLQRIIFGVGIGGSGTALRQDFPDIISEREIVQNEYIEILMETGLLGLSVFVATIVILLVRLRKNWWQIAVVVAFLAQWNFFSGYPNALHIYFVLIVFAVPIIKSSTSNLTKNNAKS